MCLIIFLLTHLTGYLLRGVAMITSELQEQVFHYLDGIINLSELEEWYVPRLPMLVTSPYTEELVSTIELSLIEMDSGLRSEEEFKEFLREFMRQHETIMIQDSESGVMYTTSASNQAVTPLIPSMPYVSAGFPVASPQ